MEVVVHLGPQPPLSFHPKAVSFDCAELGLSFVLQSPFL